MPSILDVLDVVLDYVPVVGTVKNGIQAGIHFSNDNDEEGDSKVVQAVLSGALDLFSFGMGGTIVKLGGKAVAELGSKAVVNAGVKMIGTGVKVGAVVAATTTKTIFQSQINEYSKDGKRTQTQWNASSKEDVKGNKKQEKGKKDQGGHKKNPDKDDQKKGGKGNGGNSSKKRGDHVINNGVLGLYGDIIETFLTTQNLKYRELKDKKKLPPKIVSDHDDPLSETVMGNIRDELVIQGGLQGVSNNPTEYGDNNRRVIIATVRYMQLLTLEKIDQNDGRMDEIEPQREFACRQVERMITEQAFVDRAARLQMNDDQRKKYDEALEKTIEMLRKIIELAKEWVELLCDEKKNQFKLKGYVTYTFEANSKDFQYEDSSGK